MITDEQIEVALNVFLQPRSEVGLKKDAMRLALEAYEQSKWVEFDKDDKNTWPKLRQRVIILDSGGFGAVSGRLSTEGWYLEGDLDRNADITDWQPTPEPPQK